MSDDNVFEFPTKKHKDNAMRDRTSKINNFTSPFNNSNYKINSFTVGGANWQKWTMPSLDSINNDTISFENIDWSFNLTKSNHSIK